MEAEPSVIDDRPVRSSDDKQQMAGYLSISTCQPISVRRDNENIVCPPKKIKTRRQHKQLDRKWWNWREVYL